ncbi:MAG: anthranilate phosphoribosyltransferase [Chlamydiia bacterium]|nr:anthranilate phosphoribosyltransferase [Chlamydiia bacterium]
MFVEQAIDLLTRKEDLTAPICMGVVDEIIAGEHADKSAAFLRLLHEKQETAEELYGVAKAMQEKMVDVPHVDGLLDIVGTGGDGSHSVNISTGASILAAAAGALVAKHGNRASSSKCGSADVLESFGISLDQDPLETLDEVGICFLFAPHYHPAMKAIAPIRKVLGIRTVFNLIGPLLNPMYPDYILIGVAEERFLPIFAKAQQMLKAKKSLIVHGNGMDELTPLGPCKAIEVTEKEVREFIIDPQDYGIPRCAASDLKGGTKEENARLLLAAFSGEKGPIAETLILNAGVALYLSEHAATIQGGIDLARKTLEERKALSLLEAWRA